MSETNIKKFRRSRTKRLYYFDYSFFLILVVLFAFGLVMLYSVSAYQGNLKFGDSTYYLKRQAMFGAIGMLILFIVIKTGYAFLDKLSGIIYIISLVLCVAVNFMGSSGGGSVRWFRVGPLNVQPSEIAKLAIIIFLAHLISRSNKGLRETKNILKAFLLVIPFVVVIAYTNLSTAIIVAGIAFVMLFVAARRSMIFVVILIIGALGVALFIVFQGYRSNRILVWFHPEDYSDGFQTMQALYAIGSGGVFGRGLGASMQKLGFVPAANNDMIFSIICEELGIIGAVGLIVLYILFAWRCLVIALNATDQFGSFLVIGIMTHISLQVVLHVAVCTNTIPNTGVTLPYISYGGSALIMLLFEAGIVLSVSAKIPIPLESDEGTVIAQ